MQRSENFSVEKSIAMKVYHTICIPLNFAAHVMELQSDGGRQPTYIYHLKSLKP